MITRINTKPLHEAIMDDEGETYSTTFEYQVGGDAELYGSGEWRTGRVVWQTSTEWKDALNQERRLIDEEFSVSSEFTKRETIDLLEDESAACDWFKFALEDENGDSITREEIIEQIEAMV